MKQNPTNNILILSLIFFGCSPSSFFYLFSSYKFRDILKEFVEISIIINRGSCYYINTSKN
jgi:hypothetical protein